MKTPTNYTEKIWNNVTTDKAKQLANDNAKVYGVTLAQYLKQEQYDNIDHFVKHNSGLTFNH